MPGYERPKGILGTGVTPHANSSMYVYIYIYIYMQGPGESLRTPTASGPKGTPVFDAAVECIFKPGLVAGQAGCLYGSFSFNYVFC